ncbi:MAG: thioredoxin [Oscillospiraceae bacterium]
MAISFTNEKFKDEVENGKEIVLVDFWAEWCGPCRMLGPIIDDISKEYEGKIVVGKVNVDEQSEIAARYEVMSIPTVILFKNGKLFDKSVGLVPKAKLIQMIEKAL